MSRKMAHKAPLQQGNTAVEKLKYFVQVAQAKMKDLDMVGGSLIRFRGDELEISVDRRELTPQQEITANDSAIYIKTGLLISLTIEEIISRGYRPVLRTFPRFDEPDLIAFMHLSEVVPRDSAMKRQDEPSPAALSSEQKRSLIHDLACNRALYAIEVQNEKYRNQLMDVLENSYDCSMLTVGKGSLKQKIELVKTPEGNELQLFVVRSRQNTPAAWINTGLFLGEAIQQLYAGNNGVYPLSLQSCPSYFQEKLSDMGVQEVKTFPQLVCVVG